MGNRSHFRTPDGLESVKKSQQVARLPRLDATSAGACKTQPGSLTLTLAEGMKRLAMPIAALLAAVFVGLVVTSWLIDKDAVRRSVEQQLRVATGLDLVGGDDVEISLLPASYVTLRKVGLKGADAKSGELLTVDELTANLRLLPLLARRYEIADVTLVNPQFNVTRDADGRSNWTPIIETLAKSIKPGIDSTVSFSEIRIVDGILTYKNAKQDVDETISDIDLSLGWPSISRSFAATGQFDWRGERIDGSLSIADFIAALSGDRSGLKLRAMSVPLKVAFDGTIANRASLLMEGTLSADSPSLRNAMRWAGETTPGAGGMGRFALKARANVVGESIALTNVNVELDGNAAEGVITYTKGEQQIVQATLAAETLDFTPYIATVRLLASGARDWNRQLFDLRGLSATDLDMRLSAAKVIVGPSKLGRTALGANLRNGALVLSVGEAQIYGGILKGSLGVARSDAVADVKAQFQLTDIDLEAGAAEMFGFRKLTGRGNINVALDASGASPYALTQKLGGTATLIGHDGTLSGFNLEQLLKRLERRPLSGLGNFRNGNTPFDKLNVAIHFNDGTATIDDARIEGPTALLTMTGTASVPAREYDLKGVAGLTSANAANPAFQLPFVVQGPWDDPLVFPDSDSLIRRSPASAPLLDSLKDRKTRDAVKSVIDRFTGNRAPSAAPATQVPPPSTDTPAPPTAASKPVQDKTN